MNEIEVGGNTYRIGRIDAFKQFHIARRIAPALTAAGESVNELVGLGKSMSDDDSLFHVLAKVSEVMARMPDDDVNYVIHTCLGVASRRQQDERYANVMRGNQLMFQDLDMPSMIQVTLAVLRENMGGFFQMLPGGSSMLTGSAGAV